MARVVKLKNLGKNLNKTVEGFRKKGLKAANKATREAWVITLTNVIRDTPVDEGGARGAWIIGKNLTNKLNKPEKNKGVNYVESRLPSNILNQRLFFFNNQPYINMLEFGGYGDGPKTTGGFSKQAPKGMVRINIRKFSKLVRKRFKIK